jgi:hypothetical protein
MVTTADCSAHPTLWEFFVTGEFVDGWICAMTGGDATTALLLFGLIFGGIELSLFVSTRSLVSPAVVAILFGGVIFSVVPATLTNLALVAILLLLGGLGLLVAYRSGS